MAGEINSAVAIPLCLGLVVLAIVGLDWVGREFGKMIDDDLGAHGDVARVPEELRLPSKKVGGRPRKAGEPVTNADTNQQIHPSSHDGEPSL